MININVNLPWPPSVNHYWFTVACKGGGRLVLGKAGRVFRDKVLEAIADANLMPIGEDRRLAISINVFEPDRRRRDLDNLLKPTLDALQYAGTFPDDSQIDFIQISRSGIPKETGGRLQVQIVELKKEIQRTSS